MTKPNTALVEEKNVEVVEQDLSPKEEKQNVEENLTPETEAILKEIQKTTAVTIPAEPQQNSTDIQIPAETLFSNISVNIPTEAIKLNLNGTTFGAAQETPTITEIENDEINEAPETLTKEDIQAIVENSLKNYLSESTAPDAQNENAKEAEYLKKYLPNAIKEQEVLEKIEKQQYVLANALAKYQEVNKNKKEALEAAYNVIDEAYNEDEEKSQAAKAELDKEITKEETKTESKFLANTVKFGKFVGKNVTKVALAVGAVTGLGYLGGLYGGALLTKIGLAIPQAFTIGQTVITGNAAVGAIGGVTAGAFVTPYLSDIANKIFSSKKETETKPEEK